MINRLNATYSKFILEMQLNSRSGTAPAAAPAAVPVQATSNRNVNGRERGRSSAAAASTANTISTPVNREQAQIIKIGVYQDLTHFFCLRDSFFTFSTKLQKRYEDEQFLLIQTI